MERERRFDAFWGVLDALRGMGRGSVWSHPALAGHGLRGSAEALGLRRTNAPKLAGRKGKRKPKA